MSETNKSRPRHSHYCAAISCYNSRAKQLAVSFFRFPKERDRCGKWAENCRREDLRGKTSDALHRNYVLCSNHFECSQFMNAQAKNKLIWNAIPTLFNIPDPPLSIAEEKARGCPLIPPSPKRDDSDDDVWEKAQLRRSDCNSFAKKSASNPAVEIAAALTDEEELPAAPAAAAARLPKGKTCRWASMVLTPQQLHCIKSRQTINRQRVQIWRLKKQVQVLKAKAKIRHTVEDIIQFASKYMCGVSHDFFANQLRMASKKDHGKRWTEEDKFFALMLNCISVEAYRLCSKVFNLPSIRSLQRWLKGFKQAAPDFGVRLKAYKQKLMQATEEVVDKSLSSACTLDSGPEQMSSDATQSVLDSLVEGTLDSTTLFQTLLPMDDRSGDCLDERKLRAIMMTAAPGGTESSLPLLDLTEISSQTAASLLSAVVTPKRARGPHAKAGKVRAPRQKCARKVESTCQEQQKLELLSSLSTLEGQHQPQEVHMELQSEHLTLDPQTFQLLASAGHLGDGTTFTAVQEVNTEGTVTLTPITNGMPITLASDTVNLEIVTLDVTREAIGELGITEQIV